MNKLSTGIIIIVLLSFFVGLNIGMGLRDKDIKKIAVVNTALTKENVTLKNRIEVLKQAHKWVPVIEKLMTPLGKHEIDVLVEVNKQMEIKEWRGKNDKIH